jgi:hypothetical protein
MRDGVAFLAVLIAAMFAGCAAMAPPHNTAPAHAETSASAWP